MCDEYEKSDLLKQWIYFINTSSK